MTAPARNADQERTRRSRAALRSPPPPKARISVWDTNQSPGRLARGGRRTSHGPVFPLRYIQPTAQVNGSFNEPGLGIPPDQFCSDVIQGQMRLSHQPSYFQHRQYHPQEKRAHESRARRCPGNISFDSQVSSAFTLLFFLPSSKQLQVSPLL